MTQLFRICADALKSILWLGAALLILISTSTWAQPIKDVKKWLKEFKGQLKQADTTLMLIESETPRFNLPSTSVVVDIDKEQLTPSQKTINDDNFEVEYQKVARRNRERIRQLLKRVVEINLINSKEVGTRHRVYINSVERYIASYQYIDRLRLELLLADEKSNIKIKYTFR